MDPTWLGGVIDPILWIPIIPAIILAIWKGADADYSLRPRSHVKRMICWIGLSFMFYFLSHVTVLGLLEGFGATTVWITKHESAIHVLVTSLYLSFYLFAWTMFRMEPKKTDIPSMIGMQNKHRQMSKVLDNVSERNDDIAQKLVNMEKRVEQNGKKMERMKEKRQDRNADLHQRIDEAEEDYENALNGVMSELRDTLRTTRSGYQSLEEQVEKMKEAVKSFKGKQADEQGLSWQDELAQRMRAFGYEAEVNLKSGADLVVNDPATGTELAVVSAKAYNLRTKRGLTGDIEAEVKRAKEDGAPLVVAVKNKLNGQELYHFCQPEDLDDFTCSAPARLTGGRVTEEQKKETQEGRKALRDLLADRMP